ncbi:MAG: aminoacetone oxidase family FAD-binding enzyme [Comamonas sp.]|nr:aminoacetone oxidase family FAD-binding enzyme [Comamonas sp.]
MHSFDVVIVGAGAAGLFCAGVAGQLGLKVLVLDHSEKVAEKIRISGGGRCNFTNLGTSPANFLGENPRFCRSALAGYTPAQFVALMHKHQIPFHEKHKGQLFCDRSAEDIIQMLLAECAAGGVTRWQPCSVKNIRFSASSPHGTCASSYEIDSSNGTIHCAAVVVATGGLSIPKIGATDWGYRVAKQFDLPLVEQRPALVPLTFDEHAWAPFAQLSGLSLPVQIETGSKKEKTAFLEDLLFTHRGLSGPGVLQISSYWQNGTPIRLNLAPDTDLLARLQQASCQPLPSPSSTTHATPNARCSTKR